MHSNKPLNTGIATGSKLWIGVLLLLASRATWSDSPALAKATVEEARVPQACQALAALDCDIQTSRPTLLGAPLKDSSASAASRLGTQLWRRAQQTIGARIVDDRPLYWQRLSMKREFKTSHGTKPAQAKLLMAFERASRGFDDLAFTAAADLNILVTGFDPFGLHNRIDQSNPSGVAALSFDGLVITANGKTAELQSAMFPVRFADFDDEMVESVIEPLLANGTVDAIVTISMGREGFDLERFPGRRRSATAPDNLLVKTGANTKNPLVPLLGARPLDGPEFVEFTLPVTAMLAVQTPYPVVDNHKVATLERGRFAASSLKRLNEDTAVSGSGGGYLSNEISYRSLRLVHALAASASSASANAMPIAAGHIHTPRIAGADPAATHAITWQIRAMLEALVTQLPLTN